MIKKLFIAFLLLLFCWAVYLMQVDPEAEAFFYSYSEQEKEEIDREVNNWMNHKPVKISVAGDIDIFGCWNDTDWNLKVDGEICASNEELHKLVSQNQDLFDKYQLFKKETGRSEPLSGQTLINAHRLLMIKTHLIITGGETEKALSLLVEDNNFWKKRVTERAPGWVAFALYRVHLSINFSTLPYLLNTDTNFTKTESTLLKNLLTSINAKDIKVKKIIQVEFEVLKNIFPELKKDSPFFESLFLGAFINQAYNDTQAFLGNTGLSFVESCKKTLNFKPRDKYSLKSSIISFIKFGPTGSLADNLFETTTSRPPLTLVTSSLLYSSAKRKLLNLIVLIKEKNIPSSQISAFIKDNPDLATNPLTGSLFEYDQEEKKISMDATECSESWSISLSNFN